MERLLEYISNHPLLVGAAVLAAIVVFTYESRMRGTRIRRDLLAGPDPPDEPGRAGARHPQARRVRAGACQRRQASAVRSDPDRGRQLQALQGQAGGRVLRFRVAGGRGGAPAQRSRGSPRHSRCAAASPAGARRTCRSPRRPDERAGGRDVHHQLVSLLRTRAPPARRPRARAFDEIDVESAPEKRAEMHARSGRRSVPQIFIGEQHVGGSDDLAALEAAGKLDALLGR